MRPCLEKATRHTLGMGNHWPLKSEASSVMCAHFLCYTTRSPSICPTHTAAWVNEVAENCRDNIKNGELDIDWKPGQRKERSLEAWGNKVSTTAKHWSQRWTAETPGTSSLSVGVEPHSPWCLEGDLQKQLHFSLLLLVPPKKSNYVGLLLGWCNQLPHGGKKK